MGNRDFRDRLKNHTSEVNPAAWDQMQSLLDSVPEVKKEDKKKKRGFWLFFFGLGFIALLGITWMLMNPLGTSKMNENLSTNKAVEDSGFMKNEVNESNVIKNRTLSENQIVLEPSSEKDEKIASASGIEKENGDEATFTTSEILYKGLGFIEKGISTDEARSKNIEEGGQGKTVQHQEAEYSNLTTNDRIDEEKQSTKDLNSGEWNPSILRPIKDFESDSIVPEEKSIKFSNAPEQETSGRERPEIIDQKVKEEDDLNNKTENNINDEMVVDKDSEGRNSSEPEEYREAILPLSKLILPFEEIVERNENATIAPVVKIVNPSRFSMFAGGGYALFNDNPGFIVNGGVYYDVDRILDLETNLGFAYGSAQNIPDGEKFTFEKQFDSANKGKRLKC